jgi:peptide/nickel transport system substrate-binding protein
MFTNGPANAYPVNWAMRFHSSEIPEQANNWAGANTCRYNNPEMDELLNQMTVEMDPDEQVVLFQEMNRRATEEVIEIPIIHRTNVATVANDLAGYHFVSWLSDLWDIGNWYRE